MAIYTLPIVLMIEADSAEEAMKAVEDWSEEVDVGNDLPTGTEDIDIAPATETNDEGQRVLLLPMLEDIEDDDYMDDEDEADGFNDGDEDF